MFCHRSPYAVGADGERNPIEWRTQSDWTANATRSDGERNPPLKINILTTDSVVSSLLTLNFCGFRAFRGHFFFPRNSQNSEPLAWECPPTDFTEFTEV